MLRLPLVAAAAGVCSAQVDPANSAKMSVYHLNPRSAGAIPVNMDTGDARGDLYFYLGQFLLPLECAQGGGMSGFDCSNPEREDPDLVVTKVDLEYDNRFTMYSACNLCNGTDPFKHTPCEVGSYVCDCFSHHYSPGGGISCDPTKVGMENITEKFGGGNYVAAAAVPSQQCSAALSEHCGRYQRYRSYCSSCVDKHHDELTQAGCTDTDLQGFCGGNGPAPPSPYGHRCSPESADWECWHSNIARKTGGFWYSTLAEGQCNGTAAPCGWNVVGTQTVKEPCLKDSLMTAVEQAGPGCFSGCNGGVRNQTSPCWIGCFFDTMLGEGARNSSTQPLGGMAVADIEKGWTNAFADVSTGGCQPL